MDETLKEYLVKIGWDVDELGFDAANKKINDFRSAIINGGSSMAASFTKAGLAIFDTIYTVVDSMWDLASASADRYRVRHGGAAVSALHRGSQQYAGQRGGHYGFHRTGGGNSCRGAGVWRSIDNPSFRRHRAGAGGYRGSERESVKRECLESMSLRASAHAGVAIRSPKKAGYLTRYGDADCHTSDIGHWLAMTLCSLLE